VPGRVIERREAGLNLRGGERERWVERSEEGLVGGCWEGSSECTEWFCGGSRTCSRQLAAVSFDGRASSSAKRAEAPRGEEGEEGGEAVVAPGRVEGFTCGIMRERCERPLPAPPKLLLPMSSGGFAAYPRSSSSSSS
jgi:hypothetical protein